VASGSERMSPESGNCETKSVSSERVSSPGASDTRCKYGSMDNELCRLVLWGVMLSRRQQSHGQGCTNKKC
jgi:hypothetical protein